MKFNKLVMTCAVAAGLAVAGQAKTYTREEFRIRDPFVLPEKLQGTVPAKFAKLSVGRVCVPHGNSNRRFDIDRQVGVVL